MIISVLASVCYLNFYSVILCFTSNALIFIAFLLSGAYYPKTGTYLEK